MMMMMISSSMIAYVSNIPTAILPLVAKAAKSMAKLVLARFSKIASKPLQLSIIEIASVRWPLTLKNKSYYNK